MNPTSKTETPPSLDDQMKVRAIYVSPGHNFFGHHGQPPGEHPIQQVERAELFAGRGIMGDRFFDHRENYKGQVTFFSREVYEELCGKFFPEGDAPGAEVFRRNVLVEGLDLNSLIGKAFQLQGVEFFGVEECSPCYWMDQAFAPGAHEALRGRGGLRARMLIDGTLRVTGP